MAVVGIDLGSQTHQGGDPGRRRDPRWRLAADRGIGGDRGPDGGAGGSAADGPQARGPEGRGGDRHPQRARHRGREHRGPEATLGGELHRHGSLLPLSPGADGPVYRRRQLDGHPAVGRWPGRGLGEERALRGVLGGAAGHREPHAGNPGGGVGPDVAAGHRPGDSVQPVRGLRRGRDPVLHPQGPAGSRSRCARRREPVHRRRPVGDGAEGGRAVRAAAVRRGGQECGHRQGDRSPPGQAGAGASRSRSTCGPWARPYSPARWQREGGASC